MRNNGRLKRLESQAPADDDGPMLIEFRYVVNWGDDDPEVVESELYRYDGENKPLIKVVWPD